MGCAPRVPGHLTTVAPVGAGCRPGNHARTVFDVPLAWMLADRVEGGEVRSLRRCSPDLQPLVAQRRRLSEQRRSGWLGRRSCK